MSRSRLTYHAEIIGKNLKNVRLRCGWSQADLGGILCITSQQVQKYESGKNRILLEHIYTLKKSFEY